MTEAVKINLGAGHWKHPGWLAVDLDLGARPDVCADLAAGLPFADGSASLLLCEDTFDQLVMEDAAQLLSECHRVLQPGGVLRLLLPDLDRLVRLYLDEPDTLVRMWVEDVGVPLVTGTPGEVLNRAMRVPDVGHAYVYDRKTLRTLMSRHGFEAREAAFGESEVPGLRGVDQRPPDSSLSMYFDCYRR